MASARRVRQDAEAAAKRYAEYASLIAGYNARVDQMNSGNEAAVNLYNQQVAEFKAFQESVEKGQAVAVANLGLSTAGGYENLVEKLEKNWPEGKVPAPLTPEQENIAIAEQVQQAQYINQKVIEANAARAASFGPDGPSFGEQPPPYDPAADPNYPKSTVQPTWIDRDSPEGQKVIQQLSNFGSYAIVGGKGGKIVPMDLDKKGFPKDAATMVKGVENLGALPTQVGLLTIGDKQHWVNNGDGTATKYLAGPTGWYASGSPIRILAWDKSPPTQNTDAGPVPEQPKDWNPSLRERAELENPTVDAAGSNMAAAMGSYVKTGLMNEASRNSALVDEAGQPLTSTDTGVLNRVMRGIL